MKIRIRGNSIRFRLLQAEVKQFGQAGEISEVTMFGNNETDRLSFVLRMAPSGRFDVRFINNSVTVLVPQQVGAEWASSEQVGFEERIDTGRGETITVLVEKDFKCLDGSDLENEDAFPNPKVNC